MNCRTVLVYKEESKQFESRLWEQVTIGDLVKVQKDEFFPADLLLIKSSATNGIASIETLNIDGEVNIV